MAEQKAKNEKKGAEKPESSQAPKASGVKPGAFTIGDTVGVNVRIIEGNKERLQTFEGVVIAIKNKGQGKSFTVRKVSYGVGVERVFPFASPRLESVKRIRSGHIRRSKLYYLRQKTGKQSRIREKATAQGAGKDQAPQEQKVTAAE